MTTSTAHDTAPAQPLPSHVDVIVVGGGNAGFSAAHAAALRGRSVLLLERGSADMSGGNSFYTAGATRISHSGFDDIADFIEADSRHAHTEVPAYSAEEYTADLVKVTNGKNDPELTRVLTEESGDTLRWLSELGLKYRLMYERQAYERPDGSFLFWGGLHVGNVGGGEGLMADHAEVAARLGVDVRYGVTVTGLLSSNGTVTGVTYRAGDAGVGEITGASVVLAAGGFETNAELRGKYLGPGWEHAKVRGTPYNDGVLLEAALGLGAVPGGDWSTCHSVQWDAFTDQNESNRELTNRLTRGGYPLGIIVNRNGERFLDEGADYRNYTYAKYGKEILQQPGSIAYQIFDAEHRALLRAEEYDMPGISVQKADTLEELAELIGVDAESLVETVLVFNASIDESVIWDPTIKDGRRASVTPPKSNWAAPLEQGPFYAFAVTCGITFTFGGLKSDTHGRVLDSAGQHVPGLYVCGEMLGGLFSENYPGGSGLAAGMVFGRRAGALA
ncbi:FAD-dependent tricarballylate dehydrogenase TcuA [Cryobacterium sp. N19]|uniref:FAD-dependent tricarballylate dehydrogenase TcuA n=1 Tax=Cryobacterium sp. N19 TaxID=2048288 RepID=UPI000CE3BEFB|nr:FAD-dependent tricarballylate dehydrogenase TcuA [Cryobacterium sp. N19]